MTYLGMKEELVGEEIPAVEESMAKESVTKEELAALEEEIFVIEEELW